MSLQYRGSYKEHFMFIILPLNFNGCMIDYYSSMHYFYLFSVDASYLRKEHRIVGSFIGCPSKAPRQVGYSGLPLLLMPEEVNLLLLKDAIELIDNDANSEPPSQQGKRKFSAYFEQSKEEQKRAAREGREKEILENANLIVSGKRKKALNEKRKRTKDKNAELTDSELEELSDDKIIKEELRNVEEFPKQNTLIQTLYGEINDKYFLYPNDESLMRVVQIFLRDI